VSSSQNLTFLQNNDVTVTITVTDPTNVINNVAQPLDLTGSSATFLRKKTNQTPDTDPSVITYNGTIDSTPTTGKVSFTIPKTDNAVAGTYWWRVDVTKGASKRTADCGALVVQPV
jgi:hypothetical protein